MADSDRSPGPKRGSMVRSAVLIVGWVLWCPAAVAYLGIAFWLLGEREVGPDSAATATYAAVGAAALWTLGAWRGAAYFRAARAADGAVLLLCCGAGSLLTGLALGAGSMGLRDGGALFVWPFSMLGGLLGSGLGLLLVLQGAWTRPRPERR